MAAAATLERLAAQAKFIDDDALSLLYSVEPLTDEDGIFSLALSEAARHVGFRIHPRNINDFIYGLVRNYLSATEDVLLEDGIDESEGPKLLLQTVVEPAGNVTDGTIIRAVTLPWFEIIEWMMRDPRRAFEVGPRLWEEIIAGAYQRARFDRVILTPRSGDLGRDVIAEKKGLGVIRVIDQVKAYGPDHRVTADDVRALLGVVMADGASKGFLTTTSTFAPGLRTDRLLVPFVPSRLELVDGRMLMQRLRALALGKDD